MTMSAAALVQRFRLDVTLSLGARALEAGAKFGLYALAARALGGHAAGQFFLALSVVHIVATIARLGLEKPITRHVAAELAVGHATAARRAALKGSAAILAASVLAALGLAMAAPIMAHDWLHQPDMVGALLLAALVVPVQNAAYSLAYVLVGLERSAAAQLVMNALAPTLCLAALVLGMRSLDGLLVAYAGAFAVCIGLGLIFLRRDLRGTGHRGAVSSSQAHEPLPSLWSSARPLFVVEVAQAALLSVPVLAIGIFSDPASVSVFSLASRLSMLVTTVVLSLGAMAAPVFARHYRLGDWDALRLAASRNRRLTILFCLPLILLMTLGAGPLLTLLGVDAVMGVPVLLVLLCGQLVFCLLPSRDVLLAMAGEGARLRRLSLWQLALCCGLCALMIPAGGALGAAFASATTWIAGAVALAWTARRRFPRLRA